MKLAPKVVTMLTVKRATVLLLTTAWGPEWVGVVAVASAMALDMDHHLLSMVLMPTLQFLWCMDLNHQRSMLTGSLTSFASMEM